jgi:plastocyanin
MVRRTLALGFVAAILLAACGGGGGGGGATTGSCTDLSSGTTFTIVTQNTQFAPTCVVAKRSQGLVLQNKDAISHTFTIVNTSVDIPLDPSTTKNLAPINNGIQPGTYIFYCKIHGHPDGTGMAGKITVS